MTSGKIRALRVSSVFKKNSRNHKAYSALSILIPASMI